MKLGLIHYRAPGDTVAEFLQWAADTGFETVELMWRDLEPEGVTDTAAGAAEIKQVADDLGIEIAALSLGNDFVLLDDAAIAEQVERMKRIGELTLMLGCHIFRTEGGQPKESVPEDQHAAAIIKSVEAALPVCEQMDLSLAIDNHGVVSNDHKVLMAVLEHFRHPRVGTNLDTMNYRWFGYSVDELPGIYEAVAPYVLSTHLKDGRNSRPDYVGAALGEGEIPLESAVASLKAAGFEGPWHAECEAPEDFGVAYAKCLKWMQANI